MNTKWFWFKIWFKKMRFIHFRNFYIMLQFLQSSNHGEYDLKLGISYNSKNLYSDSEYKPYQKYKRKAREIKFHFLVGYIAFGYWGKKHKKTEKVT